MAVPPPSPSDPVVVDALLSLAGSGAPRSEDVARPLSGEHLSRAIAALQKQQAKERLDRATEAHAASLKELLEAQASYARCGGFY